MKILLALSLLVTAPSFAALSIKPGLWTVETKMKRDGKEFDPQAQMKAAMAKMTPEQKKQMEAMMKKMGHGTAAGGSPFGMSEKGMQFCFTGEMLKNEEMLNQHHDQNCTHTFPVKTSTKVVTEFKCKNGADGRAEWIVKDSAHYVGSVVINKDGKKSEVNYSASYAAADCGDVKPLENFINKNKPVKK